MVHLNNPKLVYLQETKLEQITQQVATEILDPGLDSFNYLLSSGTRADILYDWRSYCLSTAMITMRLFSISM
jgi:hypothetical protein